MAEVKQEVIEISNTDNKVDGQIYLNINEYEVIDALIITGKEQTKKYTVYPVLD